MNLAEKVSKAELAVMRILWDQGEAVSFKDIRIRLQEKRQWEKSTVNTLIRRLADKGVIAAHKQDVTYYTPNITEAEYIRVQEENMLDTLYAGSAKSFAVALCRRGKLSEADIDELKAYFTVEEEQA